MSYLRIALKAQERGEVPRAAITLIEGLKRQLSTGQPPDAEALELLLNLYGNECESPGLERDLVGVLAAFPEASFWLGQLRARLTERECTGMVRGLERVAARHHLHIEDVNWAELEPPPPEPDPTPPPPLADPDDPDAPPALAEASALSEPSSAPEVSEASEAEDAAEASSERVDPPAQDDPETHEATEPELVEAQDAPLATTTDHRKRQDHAAPDTTRTPSPMLRAALAFVLVVALGLAVVGGWRAWSRSTEGAALAQHLVLFDPLNATAFTRAVEQSGGDGGEGQALFAKMFVALETDRVEPEQQAPETVWGVGAQVFMAMQRRDLEGALAKLSVMERRWPEELATWWARARFEEARGEAVAAREGYARALKAHPQFVSGLLGMMRVATRCGDTAALKAHAATLATLYPQHPYLALNAATSPPLAELLALRPQPVAALEVPGHDRFMRAVRDAHAARQAFAARDLDTLKAKAFNAARLDGSLSAALWWHAIAQAASLRPEDAAATFTRLARLPGLTARERLKLMIVAPRVLTEAGRPDLAWPLTFEGRGALSHRALMERMGPPGEVLSGAYAEARPVALSLDSILLVAYRPLMSLAQLETARTLAAMGQDALAARQLDEVPDTPETADELGALRVVLAMRTQHQRRITTILTPEAQRPLAEVAERWLAGDPDGALERLGDAKTAASRTSLGLRLRALWWAEASREGRAIEALSSPDWSLIYRAGADRALARVRARVGQPDARFEQVALPHLTGLDALLDLAETARWRRDKAAQTWLDRAAKTSSQHPEVTWALALLAQSTGNTAALKDALKALGAEPARAISVQAEVGRMWLAQGRTDEGRRALTEALTRGEGGLLTVRALGGALAADGAPQARQDAAQLLALLQGARDRRAQAAEMLLWLGVLQGSRSGEREALATLHRARSMRDGWAEWYVELARFYEAGAQTQEARRAFTRAAELDPAHPAPQLGLARLATAAKDTTSAREHLERFLALSTDPQALTSARAQLDALDKKPSTPAPTPDPPPRSPQRPSNKP